MQNEKTQQAEKQIAQTHAQKLPYEPPTATFVPLKLEERLLACNKTTYAACLDEGAVS